VSLLKKRAPAQVIRLDISKVPALDERTLKLGLLLVETDCIVGRLFGLDEMLNNECGGCDDRSVSIEKIKNKK
jgi:hypothetical protein